MPDQPQKPETHSFATTSTKLVALNEHQFQQQLQLQQQQQQTLQHHHHHLQQQQQQQLQKQLQSDKSEHKLNSISNMTTTMNNNKSLENLNTSIESSSSRGGNSNRNSLQSSIGIPNQVLKDSMMATVNTTTLMQRRTLAATPDTCNASFSSASIAGSLQDEMSDHWNLTQAGLEEYNIRVLSNYEAPLMFHHQHQSSYAQSEGYHSYVSSSDSSSATPLLDRLRRESEILMFQSQRGHNSSQSDLAFQSCLPSPTLKSETDLSDLSEELTRNKVNPHIEMHERNNHSSGSTSSTETLKCFEHNTNGDTMKGSDTGINETNTKTDTGNSTQQLIAHSSKVLTPQKRISENLSQASHMPAKIQDDAVLAESSPSTATSTLLSSSFLNNNNNNNNNNTNNGNMNNQKHKCSISLTISNSGSILSSPDQLTPKQNSLPIMRNSEGSKENISETLAEQNSASIFKTPISVTSMKSAAPLTENSVGSAFNRVTPQHAFTTSSYTKAIQTNTMQYIQHPKPQYSIGMQKSPQRQTAPQISPTSNSVDDLSRKSRDFHSVAELINNFERTDGETELHKYSFIDPNKTQRVPNPALKAIQKNALQSYYERQQQQFQQFHDQSQHQKFPQGSNRRDSERLHLPLTPQYDYSQLLRTTSTNLQSNHSTSKWSPDSDAYQQQQYFQSRHSLPASQVSLGAISQQQQQQQPQSRLSNANDISYNQLTKLEPPPPPPRKPVIAPTLLRRSSSASDCAEICDKYSNHSIEKPIQYKSISTVDQDQKAAFNDCGMPPPPPPPRNRVSLPQRRTSFNSSNGKNAERPVSLQSKYRSPQISAYNLSNYVQPPAGWAPERPPKNPQIRVPSPELPPPPPSEFDPTFQDEPFPPPPPEFLYSDDSCLNLASSHAELKLSKSSPSRRSSFADFSRTTETPLRKIIMNSETKDTKRLPPAIPRKPAKIMQNTMMSSKPYNNNSNNIPCSIPEANAITTEIGIPIDAKSPPPPPLMPRNSIIRSSYVVANNTAKSQYTSRASYLPRQNLEKMSNTDLDQGRYKVTLNSSDDMMQHNTSMPNLRNTKIDTNVRDYERFSNLPDVLPLNAKMQSQNASPQVGKIMQNTNLDEPKPELPKKEIVTSFYPMQQQQQQQHQQQHQRYSMPANEQRTNASLAFNKQTDHESGFMSQSLMDLKRSSVAMPMTAVTSQKHDDLNYNLDTNSVQKVEMNRQLSMPSERTFKTPSPSIEVKVTNTQLPVIIPSHSDIYKSNATIATSTAATTPTITAASPAIVGSLASSRLSVDDNLFRAKLCNTTTIQQTAQQQQPQYEHTRQRSVIISKDCLNDNIEKISQLQMQLKTARLSEPSGFLDSIYQKSAAVGVKTETEAKSKTEWESNVEGCEEKKEENSLEKQIEKQDPIKTLEETEVDNESSKSMQELNKSLESKTTTAAVQTQVDDAKLTTIDPEVDGLKLMQRSEIILHVNAATAEASCQTDDLPEDEEIGNGDLTTNSNNSNKGLQRTSSILQTRQYHELSPIELDCESIRKELTELLPENDKLMKVLKPVARKTAKDYISNLYDEQALLRPRKHDVGTSTLTRLKFKPDGSRENSPEKSNGSNGNSSDINLTNNLAEDNDGVLKSKIDDLIHHLYRKIRVLGSEQVIIEEEIASNEKFGNTLLSKMEDKVRAIEITKFRTFVDDLGHITNLLLSLSERLARADNTLSNVASDDNMEKKVMESKRDRLIEQLDEAKQLKKNIDHRGVSITNILKKNLTEIEVADLDRFINMKAKLIDDHHNITSKMKHGEEQLSALRESLTQSDC